MFLHGQGGITMSEINNEEIQKNIKEPDIAIPSDIIPKEEIEKTEEGDQEFYMLSPVPLHHTYCEIYHN